MLVYGAGAAWNRLCLPGAGADPIWLESAPGPRTSATLEGSAYKYAYPCVYVHSILMTNNKEKQF